jgi:hypothetical protein
MPRCVPFTAFSLIVCGFCASVSGSCHSSDEPSIAIAEALASHQFDLSASGKDFPLEEARKNDYFLLGELHGENEIPVLLDSIWPEMWKSGYRHIGAEISPWAAAQLEAPPTRDSPKIVGLWTRKQANDARALASPGTPVLWGCDMEEMRPDLLIRELAARNPEDRNLQQMVRITKDGYSRKIAPQLWDLAQNISGTKDEEPGGISLRQNLVATLQVEQLRSNPQMKLAASLQRELLMKQQLLLHLQHNPAAKVLLRFGRNHLHRGYDARGVSTVGNFVAEFAIAHGQKAFNVGAFAAGGQESLMGETWDADERGDEPTFALLSDKAQFAATLFDLRPVRPLLHAIPVEKRNELERNLIYWADSYDALICYRKVTPLTGDE